MAQILLIDDDDMVRLTLVRGLERAGHSVTAAPDGTDGVTAFFDGGFDAVVTDILMPEQEGIETLRRIRAMDGDVPIIAISGGGAQVGTGYLDMASKLGADATLDKPVSADSLNATLKRFLGTGAAG